MCAIIALVVKLDITKLYESLVLGSSPSKSAKYYCPLDQLVDRRSLKP